MTYGEREPEPARRFGAESTSRAAGSASRHAGAVKRLVIDARESGTSTGRYVDKLIEYLSRLDPEFELIILTKSSRVEYLRTIAPKFKVIKSDYKEFTFSEQLRFYRQLQNLKPDLVHFILVHQPILYKGKVVTTMNDLTTARFRNPSKNWLVFTIKQWVFRWVNKIAARKSAAILTYSEFVKNDVIKFARIGKQKITVTYLAADKITDKPQSLPKLQGSQFIVYVGRPLPHKNLEKLIEAFTILKRDHSELKLVLAGKKDVLYQRLEKQVQNQGIPDVVFAGFVSEGQLRWLYENTAGYVFPSLSEGFGLPGLEAMAHKAPVISSSATCLPEIYGGAAHYFNPQDSVDMASKIEEVLTRPKLRAELIEKGTKQVAKYSWQKTAEQTLKVYKEVLNR